MASRRPSLPSAAGVRTAEAATSPRPVFVIMGGRVGAGASTVAAALATSFATEHRTLLVDADEGTNALHALLGATAAHTADDLLRGGPAERVLTPLSGRLTLIAGRDPALPALSSAQRRTLFQRLRQLYPAFDVVVVDAGSRAATALAACADVSAAPLIVTTADRVAAAGAYAMEKLLHLEHAELPVALVGNRQDEAQAFATRELVNGASERFLGRPLAYAGHVPFDAALVPLLGGQSPAGDRGAAALSPALMAITEIGTRALAAPGAPSLYSHSSPFTAGTSHGTR